MMRKIIIYLSIITVICPIILSADLSYADNTIRRFALVAGANDGGISRTKLQYAVSDADSMMKVLLRMGGVLPEDSLLLVEPDRENYLAGMKKLRDMVEKSRSKFKRLELIFYYSGHSDEEAILLGKSKVYYKEIKDYITGTPADVRIAILDSCSSGAFSRLKGGKRRTPFLADTAYNMKGYAFMTSSTSDEASQESDRINGSFFTHNLISGLRGAADMNLDKRVSLNEAYQFAYNETLMDTEKTLSGPQHPHYNIQMSGTGDVIMTDIRKSSAIMTLDEEISGKLFIRDKNNNLICELRKPAGKKIQFGLEEGKYMITRIQDNKVHEAEINLIPGKEILLSHNSFIEKEREYTVNRGDQVEDEKVKDEESNGEVHKTFIVSPGGMLNLDTDRGSIELKGKSGNKVDIKLLRKIKDFAVKFDKRGNDIFVTGNFQGGILTRIWYYITWHLTDMHYIITVPSHYNADLKTAGGTITINDLEGKVKSKTSGGGLRFSEVKGPVTGKTSGESIELLNCTGNVSIHTSGGDIQIGNLNGDLNARTSGGSIIIKTLKGNVKAGTSGGRFNVQEVKGSIDIRTSGGNINVQELMGFINAETSGGRFTAQGIKGFIDVKTSGSNIDVQQLMGSIDAETSGGRINVQLLSQPDKKCRLHTSGGNIVMSLIETAAVDLDAKTSGGRVTTDFPVIMQAEGELKESALKGKINGGGPVMYLRTSGGNIHIEKR